MTKANLRRHAHACRIYGMIKQTDHEMSVMELSRALDIDAGTVSSIVKERGYRVRNARPESILRHNAAQAEPKELRF